MIPYYGSKAKMAPWLIANFPEHSIYVEPFMGSLRVLLAKPPSPVERVSDIDPYLVNFIKQVRDRYHLLKFLWVDDFDRDFYRFSFENPWPEDRLEAARRFYLIRSGAFKALNTKTFNPESGGAFLRGLDILAKRGERLKNVEIQRCSYEVPLFLNDKPNAFAYCDPPYHPAALKRLNCYRFNFGAKQHSELLGVLRSLRHLKVMLSGYDNAEYRRALRDWNQERQRATTSYSYDTKRTEVIWMNY